MVVSQFRVDIPGGKGRKFIVPDEVLFVNGIPLAFVECKKPGSAEAMAEAIKQHLRYAERRKATLADLKETYRLTFSLPEELELWTSRDEENVSNEPGPSRNSLCQTSSYIA